VLRHSTCCVTCCVILPCFRALPLRPPWWGGGACPPRQDASGPRLRRHGEPAAPAGWPRPGAQTIPLRVRGRGCVAGAGAGRLPVRRRRRGRGRRGKPAEVAGRRQRAPARAATRRRACAAIPPRSRLMPRLSPAASHPETARTRPCALRRVL
jgi:hypothetical protein